MATVRPSTARPGVRPPARPPGPSAGTVQARLMRTTRIAEAFSRFALAAKIDLHINGASIGIGEQPHAQPDVADMAREMAAMHAAIDEALRDFGIDPDIITKEHARATNENRRPDMRAALFGGDPNRVDVRDTRTGQFVPADRAKEDPDGTVRERNFANRPLRGAPVAPVSTADLGLRKGVDTSPPQPAGASQTGPEVSAPQPTGTNAPAAPDSAQQPGVIVPVQPVNPGSPNRPQAPGPDTSRVGSG